MIGNCIWCGPQRCKQMWSKKSTTLRNQENSTNLMWNSLKFLKVLKMVFVRVCNICKHLKLSDDSCNEQRNVPQCVMWSQMLIFLDFWWNLTSFKTKIFANFFDYSKKLDFFGHICLHRCKLHPKQFPTIQEKHVLHCLLLFL